LHFSQKSDENSQPFHREERFCACVDDQALVGLQGVVKLSHAIVHGISLLNLDGFAPFSRWKELSPTAADDPPESEVAS